MTYSSWEASVPAVISADPVWKQKAYRLALFAGDFGWRDVTKLASDRRTVALSDQLYRAIGSISANLAEGYSRSSGLDRARFYEYALGSAREAREWYYKGRHVLGDAVIAHRLEVLSQIIRLLLSAIPQERKRMIRDAAGRYDSREGFAPIWYHDGMGPTPEAWAQRDVPF